MVVPSMIFLFIVLKPESLTLCIEPRCKAVEVSKKNLIYVLLTTLRNTSNLYLLTYKQFLPRRFSHSSKLYPQTCKVVFTSWVSTFVTRSMKMPLLYTCLCPAYSEHFWGIVCAIRRVYWPILSTKQSLTHKQNLLPVVYCVQSSMLQ